MNDKPVSWDRQGEVPERVPASALIMAVSALDDGGELSHKELNEFRVVDAFSVEVPSFLGRFGLYKLSFGSAFSLVQLIMQSIYQVP